MSTTITPVRNEMAAFWANASQQVSGLPGGGLNIAYEAVDRYLATSRGAATALRVHRKDGSIEECTYTELAKRTSRFANVLRTLGIGPGEVVATVLGRCSELYTVALGAMKNRSVYCPLFSAFGPEPIRDRLRIGGARVVVTTLPLYRRKLAEIANELPALEFVLLIGGTDAPPRILSFEEALARESDSFTIPSTAPEDPALLHFTSGTTGKPKGALHVHEAVIAHHVTGAFALDLRPGDSFWCTADPGWVTGTSYGIVSPLTNGTTLVVDEGEFDPERWYQTIQDERVTVWYTAPTAIRMLMKAGEDVAKKFDLSSLRFIASVGEALNPQAVVWGEKVFGIPIHDNWWQTETGGIMIANVRGMKIRPGSMGLPLPGVRAEIVRRKKEGDVEIVSQPFEQGEIALLRGWPSMFRAYLGEEERYRKCFAGDWYLTGDLARRDKDGYFWFVGRSDDVIKTSGHLIGPIEIETALLDHPGVADAAAIGKPDPTAGEIVKAFVVLKGNFKASPELRDELLGFTRKKLGAVVAPKEIEFLETLPKTGSEKTMRRLLRAMEAGSAPGDVSTMRTS